MGEHVHVGMHMQRPKVNPGCYSSSDGHLGLKNNCMCVCLCMPVCVHVGLDAQACTAGGS